MWAKPRKQKQLFFFCTAYILIKDENAYKAQDYNKNQLSSSFLTNNLRCRVALPLCTTTKLYYWMELTHAAAQLFVYWVQLVIHYFNDIIWYEAPLKAISTSSFNSVYCKANRFYCTFAQYLHNLQPRSGVKTAGAVLLDQ